MIKINNLSYFYKNRQALAGVSLSVRKAEIFGLLGPNGSGKSTLLKVLSTILTCKEGRAEIGGEDLALKVASIRQKIGVVFQSPSIDLKLTVFENLYYHGYCFGLRGAVLRARCHELLERFRIKDRETDLCEKLSGGLKRRVEIAKGILHRPQLMILDEPSIGLDPGARKDLWQHLKILRSEEGITVLVATHWMEEAEECDRLAVMNAGKIVALGSPEELKKEIGGDVLLIKTQDPNGLAVEIEKKFKIKPMVTDGTLQVEHALGHRFMPELVESFPGKIEAVTFRRPSLEDVFLHKTGHGFWESESKGAAK